VNRKLHENSQHGVHVEDVRQRSLPGQSLQRLTHRQITNSINLSYT